MGCAAGPKAPFPLAAGEPARRDIVPWPVDEPLQAGLDLSVEMAWAAERHNGRHSEADGLVVSSGFNSILDLNWLVVFN